MRELKFRIWDTFNNDWIGAVLDATTLHVNDWFKKKNIVFQQYTGLKDAKGKEIYEGDIVKGRCCTYGDGIAVVGLDTTLGIYYTEIDYYPSEPFMHCFSMMQEYNEVVGNIYENPELLEQ
jgi:uncharacterized phage protein (TIGR01671 family)